MIQGDSGKSVPLSEAGQSHSPDGSRTLRRRKALTAEERALLEGEALKIADKVRAAGENLFAFASLVYRKPALRAWAGPREDDLEFTPPVRRVWAMSQTRPENRSAKAARAPQPPARTPYKDLAFLNPEACASSPARDYIVKGLMAPGDVGCVFGPPGVGKSLFAPLVGFKTAQGQPVFGLRTKASDVLYVAAEDAHGMRGRVTVLRKGHGDAPRFLLAEGVTNLLDKGSRDVTKLREMLAAAGKAARSVLVIIDTLAMAFPGVEENSAEGMGRVVDVARQLTEHGAAVLIVHHGTKAEGTTPRGHSIFDGALDVALNLTKSDGGIVRGRLTKNRNGPCEIDIAFWIGTRDLGTDADGDPIRYAIAEEIAASAAPKRPKLTAGEHAALNVLVELLGQKLDGVTESEWRKACTDGRAVSGSDRYDSRWEATKRAVAGLARKALVEFSDDSQVTLAPIEGVQFDEAFRDADVDELMG